MRLGLIAAARITATAVIEPAARLGGVDIAAIAARDLSRAEAAAEKWSIPCAYGSYQELVADDSLDAVYVATPASHHRQWVLAALANGKHVLCEKPLGANAGDAIEMTTAAASAGLILMEAFHWRYHPYVGQIRTLLDSGVIGRITRVAAVANLPAHFFGDDDIRWDLSLGGGCLMDVGCYPLQWVRWMVGAEPHITGAAAECRTLEVDSKFRVELAWRSGVMGSVECSMVGESTERELYVRAIGEHGVITAYNPVLPQLGATLVLAVGDDRRSLPVDSSITYDHQLVAFATAIACGQTPPTSGADSVANMQLIDAAYHAAGLRPRPSLGAG